VGTYMTAKTKMTVGTKLKFLMIFLVITLLVTAGISFFTSHKFANQIDDLGKVQMPGSTHMNLADMMHDGIRANVYSAIIAAHSTNEDEKKAVREEAKEFHESIRSHINELEKLNLHPETKAAITPALPRIEEYVKSANELVEVSLSGDEVKARTMLPSFNEKFEALEKELATLGELIEADVAESTEHGEAIEKEAKVYNLISLGIGICLMVFFFLVVREQQNELASIVHSLMSESNKINDIAGGMTSSAQNLASATQEQASAFQESAAALEEISATIKTTELNSRRLDESSKSSYESASNGKVTIEQMLNAMDVIRSSNASMATQIEESNKRINDIVSVISEIEDKTKVINDIVFQTKLLSFNASVEAARAGEQGKGFAVVAEEVGNLATMSGNAAKEISELLSNSIQTVHAIVNESKSKVERMTVEGKTKVEQGISIANKCGSALEEIVQQTSTVGGLISEITTAVKEQATGITEVSNAMALLDQASARNSMTSNENLQASQALQVQVHKLEEVVGSLSAMMTSKKAG
jgi:methyl-accepting chemotaxis protein